MNKEHIKSLEEKGYTILRDWVSEEWLCNFKDNLPRLFKEHSKINQKRK